MPTPTKVASLFCGHLKNRNSYFRIAISEVLNTTMESNDSFTQNSGAPYPTDDSSFYIVKMTP